MHLFFCSSSALPANRHNKTLNSHVQKRTVRSQPWDGVGNSCNHPPPLTLTTPPHRKSSSSQTPVAPSATSHGSNQHLYQRRSLPHRTGQRPHHHPAPDSPSSQTRYPVGTVPYLHVRDEPPIACTLDQMPSACLAFILQLSTRAEQNTRQYLRHLCQCNTLRSVPDIWGSRLLERHVSPLS